jgi:hypothetical protein
MMVIDIIGTRFSAVFCCVYSGILMGRSPAQDVYRMSKIFTLPGKFGR